jgi:hypothetical protein
MRVLEERRERVWVSMGKEIGGEERGLDETEGKEEEVEGKRSERERTQSLRSAVSAL